jgi:hypothetical protein
MLSITTHTIASEVSIVLSLATVSIPISLKKNNLWTFGRDFTVFHPWFTFASSILKGNPCTEVYLASVTHVISKQRALRLICRVRGRCVLHIDIKPVWLPISLGSSHPLHTAPSTAAPTRAVTARPTSSTYSAFHSRPPTRADAGPVEIHALHITHSAWLRWLRPRIDNYRKNYFLQLLLAVKFVQEPWFL